MPLKVPPAVAGEGHTTVLEAVCCPGCDAFLDIREVEIVCPACGRVFPRLGAFPVLLADPDAYLAACRTQLTMLQRQAAQTSEHIREQVRAPDALASTRARCHAMVEALEGQLADVRALLDPLLPPFGVQDGGPAERVPATLEYLHYLYRDWGWLPEPGDENERARAILASLIGEKPLGRTLVLGAGGCRLAYDLHRLRPDGETVVIDLDPLLFVTAHSVVRGGTVVIREANLEIGELGQSCREWVLSARDGALTDDRFHFIVADGMDPPFAPGAFDCVLTPWFLDQGPEDVRDLISTAHRLLASGGRWLNFGPLLYEPEVPVALRFAREELFDLAARAGFRIEGWKSESLPYLVSKLNGRGKVEWVLSFSASKLEGSEAGQSSEEGPPAWLLFSHVPVPTFAGQSLAWSRTGAGQLVLSAIDGSRTVDDMARMIARQSRGPSVPLSRIRAAVREFLKEVHPACRRA